MAQSGASATPGRTTPIVLCRRPQVYELSETVLHLSRTSADQQVQRTRHIETLHKLERSVVTDPLLVELKKLRRGRGTRAPDVVARIGPDLRRVCGNSARRLGGAGSQKADSQDHAGLRPGSRNHSAGQRGTLVSCAPQRPARRRDHHTALHRPPPVQPIQQAAREGGAGTMGVPHGHWERGYMYLFAWADCHSARYPRRHDHLGCWRSGQERPGDRRRFSVIVVIDVGLEMELLVAPHDPRVEPRRGN